MIVRPMISAEWRMRSQWGRGEGSETNGGSDSNGGERGREVSNGGERERESNVSIGVIQYHRGDTRQLQLLGCTCFSLGGLVLR
jgi:hypothetical protein